MSLSLPNKYALFSDSEGPLCLNDNAFELTAHFIPDGDRLFARLSAYDDYLVDVVHRPDYHGGDTLKLVLPFFKAYGITESAIREYSEKSVHWMPEAPAMLKRVMGRMPVNVVTTSYEQFALPMYKSLGLKEEQIFCTRLALDGYHIADREAAWLRQLAGEILAMPVIDTHRLDQIFWEEICRTNCAGLFQNVTVMSGGRKAAVIAEWARERGVDLSGIMYVGDSITDTEAFGLVRSGGGLSVSFNGNQFALKRAEIACISQTAAITGILAEAFVEGGKSQALGVIKDMEQNREYLLAELAKWGVNPKTLPIVTTITDDNIGSLLEQSLKMRKYLRGNQIGALG